MPGEPIEDTCCRCAEAFMAEDIAMQQRFKAGEQDGEPVGGTLSVCRACWFQMIVWLAQSTPKSKFEGGPDGGE